MILQAMSDAGETPENPLLIGDTSFDMEMAVAAGVRGVGVDWGYHGRERLGNAHVVVDDFEGLIPLVQSVWAMQA
jgi:phosphoglycolate phosphatase